MRLAAVEIAHAIRPLRGEVLLPGDKSISHRAVLLAAMAEGTSVVSGALDSSDVRATMAAVEALGARMAVESQGRGGLDLRVKGWGASGPGAPRRPIYCSNSGTTARLLAGVLAGWDVEATLAGDASLSKRPMERVAQPLRDMGASVTTSPGGTLPMHVRGGRLRAVDHVLPVASAQVKTAILLAGLRAHGVTSVTEPAASRDHTERMLPLFGVPVERDGLTARVRGEAVPVAAEVRVPKDPSAAAFICSAAVLVPGSEVVLPDVSLNPGRAGFLSVLERMGAHIEISAVSKMGEEPVGTIRARHSDSLRAASVGPGEIAGLIDEIPVLAVVATQASGTTRFEGVGELRVKETDRLEAVRYGLAAMGARVGAGDDWLEVRGPAPLAAARLASQGDHRLAMTWAVAALGASGRTSITGFEAVEVSYPSFLQDLQALQAGGHRA